MKYKAVFRSEYQLEFSESFPRLIPRVKNFPDPNEHFVLQVGKEGSKLYLNGLEVAIGRINDNVKVYDSEDVSAYRCLEPSKSAKLAQPTEKTADIMSGAQYGNAHGLQVGLMDTNGFARVYVVSGVAVGKDEAALRDCLAVQKKGRVVFRSTYKLTPEAEAEHKKLFDELGFQVEQFWVPSSTARDSSHPGRVDLMRDK